MELANHRVFVTGGTRGIGFELAKCLLGRGAEVAVCGSSPERVAEVREELPAAAAFVVDLGDVDAIPGAVDELRSSFGRPTILVNNAGVQFNFSWLEAEVPERLERLRSEVDLNLTSPLALTACLLDDLIAAPEAAVVNVSSLLALHPKRSAPVYGATKAALRSFGRALRYQLEDRPNVRVIEVVPPVVDTGMTAGRGDGKISPADAAEAIVAGLERDSTEIYVGKARVVRPLQRVAPGAVARLMRDS
jgi:uncharacterized oxidoreductase